MEKKKNWITNVDALIDHKIQLLSKIHSFINLLKIKIKSWSHTVVYMITYKITCLGECKFNNVN